MQRIISCWLLILFLAGLPIAPSCARAAKTTSERKPLAAFTTPKDVRAILLPIKFNGKDYLFGLDTGCSHTMFDISFKDQLGKPKRTDKANVFGKRIDIEVFNAPEAFLGPLNLKDCAEVYTINLKPMASALKKDIRGLIGMDFLRRYAVQIDFDKGKVLFLRSKPEGGIFSFLRPKKNEHPEWGQKLPIKHIPSKRSYVPSVRGTIEGIKVDFAIDTGYGDLFANSAGVLESPIFKKIRSKIEFEAKVTSGEPKAESTQNALDITPDVKYALVGKFTLGQLEYQDVTFCSSEKSRLGMQFLSRHLVTFDFPNRKIYLKKRKTFSITDSVKLIVHGLDLVLRRNKENVFVYSIDPNGPAYEKGIREKDIILKVHDQDVSSHNLTELSRFLKQSDKETLTVTFKRGDEVKEVSFKLKQQATEENEKN